MKSSRSPKLQYKNADRKGGSKRDKAQKLDRKSSRGMIFENEELRLRTININAEVERGQTDIKKLRRENDQLKREIWTLRDECDRLNKRINTKLLDHDHCNCNTRGSGGGSSGCTRCPSQSNSDDSDSCDTCKGVVDCDDDDRCSDDCCQMPEIKKQQQQQHQNIAAVDTSKSNSNINEVYPKFNEPQQLHNTFDHLSVVSEETLSNSEVLATNIQHQQQPQYQQQQHQQINVAYTPSVNGSQTTLPSLMDQLTPMTPLEMVANQLNDLQAVVPPLSYFENILKDHMGSTIGMTPDTACLSPSKKIIKHTNGWDYNIQSPFAQRRLSPAGGSSSTSPPFSASPHSPTTVKRRYPPGPSLASTLTTFVPTSTTAPTIVKAATNNQVMSSSVNGGCNGKAAQTNMTTAFPVIGETVAITTMPTTAPTPPPPTLGSPKHFFSPLKPRLKINTSLAKRNSNVPTPPTPPVVPKIATEATTTTTNEFQNCDPPDIYVTNGLASPYKRPSPQVPQHHTTTMTTTSTNGTSGSISSNTTSMSPTNVSSRSRQRQQQHLHYCHHQQQQQKQQQQYHTTHQEHQKQQHEEAGNKEFMHQKDDNVALTMTTTMTTQLSSFAIGVPVSDVHMPTIAVSSAVVVMDAFDVDDANLNAALIHNRAFFGNDSTFSVDTTNFSYTDTKTTDNDDSNGDDDAAADDEDSDNVDDSTTDSTTLDAHSLACANSLPALIFGVEHCTPACVTNISDPIYAIARERSNSLISAPARTKPLMTAIINSSPAKVSFASIKVSSYSATNLTNLAHCSAANQTESVNLETILNDIEHISEDILAIQLEKTKSRGDNQNKNETAQNAGSRPLEEHDKNRKPYRSEMNLKLNYDGANTTIEPANEESKIAANENGTNTLRTRARSLERETTESPSPKIPDAMPAFPDNRTYIGFDQVNKDAHLQLTANNRKTAMHGISKSNTSSPQRPPPPAPPTRLCPPPLNLRNGSLPTVCSGINTPTTPQPGNLETFLAGQAGLTPNKSHLYKALANAAAKRAQFRLESPTLSKSLELEIAQNSESNSTNELFTPSTEAAAKRKARRVSIFCGEQTPTTPEVSPINVPPQTNLPPNTSITSTLPPPPQQLSTASCTNLTTTATATPTNPLLQSLRQITSHSTPNSPHSARRRNADKTLAPDDFVRHNSSHQHQHQRSSSSNTASQNRRSSQDSTAGGGTATVNPSAATRSRCSRRHSDGTVAVANNQRISGSSGGGGHHHHHHHHHQHSSSLVSNLHNNAHHMRHSHQDSNQETGSVSDRNSNSFASSRESSTSFSLRSSQRRKISISSHNGGKIPWCGCWGNGCL